MRRRLKASPTNPSATSLSGFTPSSCGCRNPRLYSWVAIVDALTCRNFSNVPSGSGAGSGASRSESVIVVSSSILGAVAPWA